MNLITVIVLLFGMVLGYQLKRFVVYLTKGKVQKP
jgi:hypothetical protein